MAQDDILLFPVAGMDLQNVAAHGITILRFKFLASPMQKIEEATPSQWFALQPQQTRELIAALEKATRALENAGPPPAQGPTH